MNAWGRLIKYTNTRKAKTKKKGDENKRQREALVALAEARIHVDKSKVAHNVHSAYEYNSFDAVVTEAKFGRDRSRFYRDFRKYTLVPWYMIVEQTSSTYHASRRS